MSGCTTSVNSVNIEVQDLHQESAPACPFQHENNEEENRQDGIGNSNVEEEDDEDEDVDFNPFLRETIEASSSHSSEVEDLDTDFDDNGKLKGKRISVVKDSHLIGDVEHGEETVMQTAVSHATFTRRESVSKTQSENGLLVSNEANSRKETLDTDIDGAISMRTRARYSLASFALDELETFLQETDDEDDLQNVDDEEEYKKFLTAVLHGDDSQVSQGNANVDDEDENDADFELELEEALESDHDEIEEQRITRRNRRQQNSIDRSKKQLGQSNRPLRPLLPFVPIGSCSAFEENQLVAAYSPSHMPPTNNGIVTGFTPDQIGRLHCLIHEHVQLLIQVFSVCVLDPSKGEVATQAKKLILEIVKKREQVLEWRTLPYPRFCFFPPYIQASVPDELHKMLQSNGRNKIVQPDIHSGSDQMWVPYICGPLLSVTDVAPLRLVGSYITDVTSAVQAYKRYQIDVGFENWFEKEPLFPLDHSSCSAEEDGQGETKTCSQDSNTQTSKKNLAATLIENSRKQPVAPVPKVIAKLAQRFGQFFNPALYPRKPPPAPIANRVLFTNTEDELLAMGLMEFNTDWKAIQQRFLPCKSSHQIFVRQKNRASSKAPENPIKAVRRMKNSPLTSEEVARIELGFKKYKLDWISIWRFFVPYRDPSLLPRQWRIATGTQKSYKSDAAKRAKRRLDDLRRKANKPSASTRHSSSEKEGDSTDNAIEETNCGDYDMYKEDEAYVHEAFLADWRSDSNVSLYSQASEQRDITGSGNFQTQMCTNAPSSLKPSNSQVLMRPYRARKSKYARLVKLAPDLPPVNLPPSVRVIPQSTFKRSHVETFTGNSGNASRIDNVIVGSTITSEIINSVKSGQFRSNSWKVTAGNYQHKEGTELLTEERVDSDLQMHPLLFQASQDRSLPYHPLNSRTTSFGFFPNKQPKLNLSLFHNPRQIRDAVNFLSKSSKPVEKHSSSSEIDFHPLLHDGMERGDPNQSPLRPSVSKPSRDGSSSASGSKVTGHSKKANEVNLDIHLSSVSENQEAAESRNKKPESVKDSACDGSGQKIDSGEVPLAASRSKGSKKVLDESRPEIVMEQEELSDSEDEFGDNVEFEHEEMDDSGDDTSESDQLLDVPNEEDEMETDTDNREMINTSHDCEGNHICSTMDGRSDETDLANKVVNNNNTGSSLSLNLNSHPPVSPLLKPPNNFAKYDFGPFGCPSSKSDANVVVNSENINKYYDY